MEWYLISTKSSLLRVSMLLQELNIGQPMDPLLYLRLGYKNLSTQDKETYYLLKNISDLNKEPICQANIDYLATALSTSESTQYYRLKNLQRSKLIKILKDNTFYIIDPPYPDSTFVSTVIQLLKRKRLGTTIHLYKTCNNPILRMQYLLEIKKMQQRGVHHYHLNKILPENNELITPLTSFNIMKNLS